MKKAQIHFGNHLEELTAILKAELFPEGSGPFDKRLIAVPHLGLKTYLMQSLAKDPDLQVAAGLQIVSLAQAWTKITRCVLPSTLELSLFLQHALLPLMEKEPMLEQYFASPSKEKRIGPFCDALSQYFLRYAVYGVQGLEGWQKTLWERVKRRWTFPTEIQSIVSNWQVHLFGFTFVPQSYFSFFQKANAQMYLFSPCAIFWGDFYSDKEKTVLSKNVPVAQLDLFEESFDEQHPLLASWGRVGRKMLTMVEESELPTQEYYIETQGQSCLHKMQDDFLEGMFREPQIDDSIQCVSATTPLREIEILKDTLIKCFATQGVTPRDVQVFAPDINQYAPYIHAVFADMDYTITDLEWGAVDPIAQALAQLIELPKKRFALENVLQLFHTEPFQQKFSLNAILVRKWSTLANVRWGFSKKQRSALYLQDIEAEQIVVNPEEGTWEKGLKRLLLGLAQLGGEEAPLNAIEVTEMETFNRLYTVIHSLADDLSPLYDGSKWTIPTWLRYFGCLLESYFAIDPTNDLYKQMQQLAASCDHLDKEEVPFAGVERVLQQLLTKRGKSHQAPHLQAIRFSSLSEGGIQPGKVICLLGMQEEVFPRREENASLYAGEESYRPKRNEQDRYLFLQALLSARETFWMSYVRDSAGKWGASSLVQELLSHLEGGEITHHPAYPFDPQYFQGDSWASYSQQQYALAQEKIAPQPATPLIPDFYEPVQLEPVAIQEREINIQKLCKFARHPLRYYLHEVLGIYPDWSSGPDQGEYILDPLVKYQLVREALTTPLEEVIQNGEKRGELPVNLLTPLSKKQITKEVEEWHAALSVFGIDPEEIQVKQIDWQIGDIRLTGTLDLFTPKGLLVKGKNTLEDRIRFWPQALLMQKLDLPLLLIKEQEPLVLEGSLEEYLAYFLLAEKHPSPLLPGFAKALLEGDPQDLKQQLKKADDEVWNWLLFRDPMPRVDMIHQNWSEYLRTLFGRIDATV